MGFGFKNPLKTVKEAVTSVTEQVNTAISDTNVVEQVESAVKNPSKYTNDTKNSVINTATSIAKDNNMDKPGGWVKQLTDAMNPSKSIDDQAEVIATVVDTVYDDNTDDDEDDSTDTTTTNSLLTGDAGLNETDSLGGGSTKNRKQKFSRNQSNLSDGGGKTLLT